MVGEVGDDKVAGGKGLLVAITCACKVLGKGTILVGGLGLQAHHSIEVAIVGECRTQGS